jgi:hypothetical protein
MGFECAFLNSEYQLNIWSLGTYSVWVTPQIFDKKLLAKFILNFFFFVQRFTVLRQQWKSYEASSCLICTRELIGMTVLSLNGFKV